MHKSCGTAYTFWQSDLKPLTIWNPKMYL